MRRFILGGVTSAEAVKWCKRLEDWLGRFLGSEYASHELEGRTLCLTEVTSVFSS